MFARKPPRLISLHCLHLKKSWQLLRLKEVSLLLHQIDDNNGHITLSCKLKLAISFDFTENCLRDKQLSRKGSRSRDFDLTSRFSISMQPLKSKCVKLGRDIINGWTWCKLSQHWRLTFPSFFFPWICLGSQLDVGSVEGLMSLNFSDYVTRKMHYIV